jgi:pyruvyl transferase EpsO
VVITDRLHGHVLSMILGIPHVVIDNSYGKVLSFVNTWSIESPLVRIARSVEEASALALQWSHDLIGTSGKLDSTTS